MAVVFVGAAGQVGGLHGHDTVAIDFEKRDLSASATFLLDTVGRYSEAVCVPLCEDAVAPCAWTNSWLRAPGLDLAMAERVIDRVSLRSSLRPGLNPEWYFGHAPRHWDRCVVKSRAGWLSQGVAVEHPYWREWLRLKGYPQDPSFVVEEYLKGPQIEVNGVVGPMGTVSRMWEPILQVWDTAHSRIVRYRRYRGDSGVVWNAAEAAVMDLGLRTCGFNAELRLTDTGPKVVEVHARLGEDRHRPEYVALFGGDPDQELADTLCGSTS